jgi:hydroxyacylglutathione hydrolase
LEVAELISQGYVVLDVRPAAEFGAGHVPGSINIGLGGQFAIWAASLISLQNSIVIIADSEAGVEEAQMRLARVGIERAHSYLSGGIDAWRQAGLEVATVPQITVGQLKDLIASRTDFQVLDVRRPPEYTSGHVPGAIAEPLSNLKDRLPLLDLEQSKLTAVICARGYRSSAATSILQQYGFANVVNVTGGTNAWIEAGYEVETSN